MADSVGRVWLEGGEGEGEEEEEEEGAGEGAVGEEEAGRRKREGRVEDLLFISIKACSLSFVDIPSDFSTVYRLAHVLLLEAVKTSTWFEGNLGFQRVLLYFWGSARMRRVFLPSHFPVQGAVPPV